MWRVWLLLGGGEETVYRLYNLPGVPDGAAQDHTEDHSKDLKTD